MKPRVANIFIPVRDVGRAREWYRDVLGLPVGEVQMGHLCCIEFEQGAGLILDHKLTPANAGGDQAVERGAYPLFMFASEDIEESRRALEARGVETVAYDGQVIQNGHWFNFRDLDGNLLMVCQ